MSDQPPVSVIGAGAWGTALARLLARQGVPTLIWAREPEVVEDIRTLHENRMFLAGIDLGPELDATGDLDAAFDHADVVVNAVPTQHMRSILERAVDALRRCELVVTVAKGIELETLMMPSDILEELGVPPDRIVALSGPSFAAEVAADLPTAVVAAGPASEPVRRTRDLFSTATFRVYSSDDIVSAELGGALKNVIAIAVGISDGLGFGRNARAALIARGLAEITRLGVARGSEPMTFAGLSGMGDLVLTSTDDMSRNRRVGLAIGQGRKLAEVQAEMHEVSEGVYTALSARQLAAEVDVEMPITAQVCAVLHEGKDPRQAFLDLTSRHLRDERG
ncbi:MAG: NAD(P)H-dependent glycerol-3-phosphate dehydrogenase [Ilumatobacter sp.]|uniref:NAD(P)H-dependent glycerol-3-phosphate dehydrogenase n=1 Tax=Ilumatobacter sp. TaxID=1967498 RepID=UPI00262FDB59|nr:NAD(P)H-dependent glycerol-3-phosphate dehydrogenase [Ilumatobacter sp.]MDJ0769966.1 NAD(P)H-dependent glycerol-3-phosphate dehydrogenase [Ilumatobacter sp.]